MKKFISTFSIFLLGSVSTLVIGFALAKTMSFPDVTSTDWFYNDVNNMVDWGVIQGNADGTFKPGNNVNRAELSAMWNRYNSYLKTQFVAKDSSSSSITSESSSTDSKTIDLNTKGTLNGVSLTINSVQNYTAVYSTPKSGNKYVSIDVLIENNSGKSIDINPYKFTLKDSKSYEYQHESRAVPDPALSASTLENGRSVRGFIGYEVPTDSALTELKYKVDYGKLGQFYVKLK